MIGCVCGPIGSSMPSLIAAVTGPPDPDDPAVLDPDVRLDARRRRDRGRRAPAMTTSSSDGLGRPWADARADGLRVAPDRLVAGRLAILARRGPRGRCRRAGRGRRSSGRSGRGGPSGRARLIGRRPRRRTGRAGPSASRPAPSARIAPAGRSRRKPRAAVAIEDEPRVHPVERVVRRDADHPPRLAADVRSMVSARAPPRRRARIGRCADRPGPDRPGPVAVAPAGRAGRRAASRRPSAPRAGPRRPARGRRACTSSGPTAARPAASTSAYVRAGPRRLEHRVADERDRLRRVEREPGRAMTSRQLGGGEDEEPLLLPGRQAHRRHRSERPRLATARDGRRRPATAARCGAGCTQRAAALPIAGPTIAARPSVGRRSAPGSLARRGPRRPPVTAAHSSRPVVTSTMPDLQQRRSS